jgi:hypothetical protein
MMMPVVDQITVAVIAIRNPREDLFMQFPL